MKRLGLAVGVVLVALAIVVWRSCGSSSSQRDVASAPGSGVSAKAPRATERQVRPDATRFARASIEGTVTDATTRQPIAGARVCANGRSHDLDPELLRDLACATSDARGHYRLDHLLPAIYVVSAAGKPYRPGVHRIGGDRKKTDLRVGAGEQRSGIDIQLEPGGVELTGVVADLTGGPIDKARVVARASRWDSGGGTAATETAADGTFSLWVAPGSASVVASAEGYATDSEWTYAPGKVEILLTPESALAGIVVDAVSGDPIEGARVSVGGSEWTEASTFTDAKGAFRVSRLTPGRYVATARTDRGYGRTEGSTLVGFGQTVEGVVVKLHRAIRLEGKVIASSTKEPCEDPWVSLTDAPKGRWIQIRKEPGGVVWAEGVLPGKYSVDVTCEGYQSKEKYEPIVVEDKDVTGLVWEVDPGAQIVGRVLTKAGTPIRDAHVSASTVGGDARKKEGWSSDRTLPDGSFRLAGLKAATYKLEVSSDKAVQPKDPPKVEVAAGATVQKDVVMEDTGTIKGLVVDADGRPVGGIAANARPLSGGAWWSMNDTKTDDAGVFTIEAVRPGDYRVTAQRSWRDSLKKPGTTDDAEQGERITVRANQVASVKIVVESQSGVIDGVVHDSTGAPVGDAFISAARESDAAGARKTSVDQTRWSWDDRPVLTNPDGTFKLTKLAPGKYTLRAHRKGGGEAIAEHVAVGATAKLQIKPTGVLAGAVTPPPDELTITVRDLQTGFWRRETFFRTAGRFTLPDLPRGKFQLTATAEGGQAQLDAELAEGEQKTNLAIELGALVTLTGRVVEHGTTKPVAGMRMTARPAMGGGGFGWSTSGDDRDFISDEQGKFTIKNAPTGKLVIRGMPRDWNDSEFAMTSTVKTVTGSGTIELGDIVVFRNRIKANDTAGKLGINFKQSPPDTPPEARRLEVSWIDPAGPAAKTEIKVGDVITTIDGIDVTGANSANSGALLRAAPGTKLVLGLERKATVTIVLSQP